jgi:ribonuclease VapC
LIVADASAVLAILLDEPEAAALRCILVDQGGVISPVNHWEVLARAFAISGDAGVREAESLLTVLGIEVVPISAQHSRLAADAFRRFGKRSGGGLNLGDCFAYALARAEDADLLFKGDDFPRTDIKPAL